MKVFGALRQNISPKVRYGALALGILAFVGGVAWEFAARAQEPGEGRNPVTPALREQAVETLRANMEAAERWEKVHAAEFLLMLDYPQGILDAFEEELDQFGDEPEYRIGIWRVLVQETFDEEVREEYTQKILDAFLDTDGPDRVHAAETLAKLEYSVGDEDREAFVEAAEDSGHLQLAAYASWVLAISDAEDAAKYQDKLVQLLDSEDSVARRAAAYALGFLPNLTPENRQVLIETARNEPEESEARVHLARAAFLQAPDDATRQHFEDILAKLAEEGTSGQQYLAVYALAENGSKEKLPLLTTVMEEAELDVQSAAAWAVLRIERRVPPDMTGLDWTVLFLYAGGLLMIGYYYMIKSRTPEDYLLGGRRMKSWGVGISMFASFLSTITYLAQPGEMIKHGPMYLCQIFSYPFIAVAIGWILIPYIMRLKVTTAYEILDVRLGGSVRSLGAFIFLMIRLLWMAVIIYATTDKVLLALLGLDSSWTPYICGILAGITIIYTSMGGFRAVVFTDVIQFVILFGGAFLSIFVITYSLGGFDAWWPHEWHRHWAIPKFGFQTDERITFGWMFTAIFIWHISTSGSDQMAIQRYLATRDVKTARQVVFTNLTANAAVAITLAILGMALLGYFQARPHLMADGQTIYTDADKLLPQFVVSGLPMGISGLIVAALLAAAMSSLSSGVNSSCSVITVDFINRLRRQKLTDKAEVVAAKLSSIGVGLVVMGISFYVDAVPGNLLEVAHRATNLLIVPLFILFFMAMFIRWATPFGTWCGGLSSATAAILIAYWENIFGTAGPSFLWIMPGALVTGTITGMLFSLVPIGPGSKPMLTDEEAVKYNASR